MIRSIIGYLEHHGFQIMMTGFAVVAGCALLYAACIITHCAIHNLRKITYSCALGGLVVYAVGRAVMYAQQRKEKKSEARSGNGNKDEA